MGQRQGVLAAPKVITADTELAEWHIAQYDIIRCDTSAIRIDLPAISITDLDCTIWNASSGIVFLNSKANGYTFIDGGETYAIPAYSAVRLQSCVGSVSSGIPTYNWLVDKNTKDIVSEWAITDDDTWTGTAPSSIVASGMYCLKEGVMFFSGRMYSTDGGGATALVIEHIPGFPPQAVSMDVPFEGQQLVDTTYYDMMGRLDAGQAAAADAQIEFANFTTCTDNKVVEILISGWYFCWGATAYTPTNTTGTKTPATNVATTGYYKTICDGKVGLFCNYYTADDSDGCDGFTATIPWRLQDADTYVAVKAIELAGAGGATYYNPHAYIDMANATAENRGKIQMHAWTSATDDKAVKVWCAGIVELAGWTSVATAQISQTFDTTAHTPASITKKFRFFADGALAFFSYYWTSADGNGAVSLSTESIIPPRYAANHKHALPSTQLQNATYSNCKCYVEANTTDPADREILQSAFTTATDAQTVTMEVAGFMFI